jgi:hypothetical protein
MSLGRSITFRVDFGFFSFSFFRFVSVAIGDAGGLGELQTANSRQNDAQLR